jgi:NSS family neurotransmitter:Na+ symporter
MAIFGSYIDRSRALCGEAISITVLDTSVALMAGLIIFPACFAYGVDPGAGPGLIFVTLPNVFNAMPGGRLWGTLFFLFMCFAAFSTVIAVFQNLIAFWEDLTDMPKKKIVSIHMVLMLILCLPCALGYNVLADFQPLGAGSGVLDLEDFIVSNLLLPIGCFIYVLFCTWKFGWGWDNFTAEANAGKGLKVKKWMKPYMQFILPIIILVVFIAGLLTFSFK